MSERTQITYANELARKSIHVSSLLIPLVYLNIQEVHGIIILVSMSLISVSIDALMHYNSAFRTMMLKMVGPLLRSHELRTDRFLLTGASWVLIAATLTMAIFPTMIAVIAFSILIISDTAAALVGRQFGKHRFIDKSLEGTATFIVSAWMVIGVYSMFYPLTTSFIIWAGIGSVIGGIIEAASISLKLDDNLSIPFSIAIVMWCGTVLHGTPF